MSCGSRIIRYPTHSRSLNLGSWTRGHRVGEPEPDRIVHISKSERNLPYDALILSSIEVLEPSVEKELIVTIEDTVRESLMP